MPVRLFIAVLMLTGPTPARVCTCAAAGAPETPASCPAVRSIPERDTGCGCGNHSAETETAPTDEADATRGHGDPTCEGPPHSNQHDRDCPAIAPRPVVSTGVLTSVADAPTERGVDLPVCIASSSTVRESHAVPQSRFRAGRDAVPLYLSLLSLRI